MASKASSMNRALRSLRPRLPAPTPAPWAWAAAGVLLGGSLAVVLFAPAHWLAWGLAHISAQRLQLQQVRGSVWEGSAQLVLAGGAASRDHARLPGRLQWRLRPQWNGLQAELQASCCTPAPLLLQVKLQNAGLLLSVANGSSHWPTSLLAGLGTPWNTVQLQGQLALNTQSLQAHWSAGRWRIHGQAQLDALELSSRLSTLRPLGSYRFTLAGGDTPSLQVRTLQGELQLGGSGQWVGQRLRFSGQASASLGHEAALSNLLNLLGRRRGATALITLG
ncbi:type II secretion system protein N [Giesbergeria sp.]|uniref:type II secretion system protein N n=1 Tax=Giesbergeria sp. TaxID=2818473 RepID=UPI00261041C3|nr:type II secretion system protein N [Giesbergeria sp.]